LRAGAQVDLLGAVERLELEHRPERGRRHGHLERAVQVVAAAHERVVVALADLDVQVARGPARRADLALRGELDARARVDAGGDVDRDRATAAHAPLAGALGARLGDDGAEPLARGARRARPDLAEQGARDALDRAAAVAHVARAGRRAGAAARAAARAAHDGRVDLELALRAERRLGEVDVEPHERVLAAPGARDRALLRLAAAEERLEDVLEAEPAAHGAGAAARCARVDAEVVLLALLRVGQHLVRARDVLEAVARVLARDVRVQLAREPAVRLLDLVLAR